ncbi:hypothetical protein JCM10213_003656 [Rhodosporidiobolus nylandii]
MEASTHSEGSFVLVHTNHQPPADLAQLHPYFPQLHHFTLPDGWVDSVQRARDTQPDHQLFIDHLLAIADPSGQASFPPTSAQSFSALVASLHAGAASTNPLTARSCLYYLALSLSPATASAYARDHLLPAAFRLSVRAFHALDTGNWALGVKLLADPRVTPDFVPRTFAILGSLPPPEERAQLVLSYWRLAGIDLEQHGKDEVKVVLKALCSDGRRLGANEAWALAREWKDEDEREELANSVLATCFGDNSTGRPLASHLSTLLARPFTPAEDALTTSFCASPPAPLSPTLTADWRLSKLIAESRPVDALRFWNKVKSNKRVDPSEQRDRLLAAVEANLTAVQRTTLSLEVAPAPLPAPAANPPTASSSSSVTQPAWAPAPAPAAPAPAAPPRTLAAARLAQLPPAAAPAPGQADLPLSASPFVRAPSGTHGAGGVLKALEVAQTPGRKGPSSSAFAPAVGSPARMGSPFAFPAAPSTIGGAPSTLAGGSSIAAASPAKPTLSGFGTVRQAPQPQQATPKAPRQVSRRFQPEAQEDNDGDEVMGAAPAADSPQQQRRAPDADEDVQQAGQDYAFASHVAQDPAIAATIAAAAPPTSAAKSKRSRVSNGASARDRARARGDKRRAVSTEPEEPQRRERPDSSKTVKLPPGAFPGQDEEEEHEHDEEEQEPVKEERKQPRQAGRRASRAASSSSKPAQTAKTPRRSTRQSTVEPSEAGSEADEPPVPRSTRTRRSTRASSAAPEQEEGDKEGAKPKRRSSRLSTSTPAQTPARSTRRSTRARAGAIDEEEEE